MFTFNETLVTSAADFDAAYRSPNGLADPMNPGIGFSIRSGAGVKFIFRGAFQNSNRTVAVTRTGTDPLESGWNLLANPFPAPIDWDLVTIPAGMSGQISVQQPQYSPMGNGGTYLTAINGVGTGTLANEIIPAMQGFFMRRTTAGTGSFTFNQNARVTTFDPSTIHLRTAANQRPLVRLAVEGTGPLAAVADEAVVYFEAGATPNADDRFDALRVGPSSGIWPTLSTRLANGALAQIDGRPLTGGVVTIPLDVRVGVAGSYVLHARQLFNISGSQPVQLVDALTGTVQDLRTNPTYAFTMQPSATGPRFSLRFGAGTVTSVAAEAATGALLTVWPNPSAGTVNVAWAGAEALTGAVTLTDLLGRTVRTVTVAGTEQVTLTGLPKGVYSLRVPTAAGALTRRVVVE